MYCLRKTPFKQAAEKCRELSGHRAKVEGVMHDEVPPILCAHLLRRVDEKLIGLLGSLTDAEWNLQTVARRWKVRDVAAHLLDTVLRENSLWFATCAMWIPCARTLNAT